MIRSPRPNVARFLKFTPYLTSFCILVGLGWLFVLPLDECSRRSYISENALLPGQVEAYFGGSELNILRAYRAEVESWALSQEPDFYVRQFEKVLHRLQLKTGQQNYSLSEKLFGIGVNGTNVYGILRAPRGDATEAIVLSTSWRTIDGEIDIGGVSLLMSLAGYFKRWSLWSKDIIFLLVAEPLAGTSLWLEAYHSGVPRYTTSLPLKSGEIQAAIQLSHPYGTHFESISIGYEGTNGQLANLDLINSAVHIAGAQVRVPVTVQGVEDHANGYEGRLKILLKGMAQQGLGLSTGSGTFGRYKIDAITLKATGGTGNHDDIAFGRVIESLCRSLNNLLEHLHQSFFFYFLLSPTGTTLGEPGRFVSIGTYLPAAMVMAASFSITAITLWMQSSADSVSSETEKSPSSRTYSRVATSIGFPLGVVAILHGIGFIILASFDLIQKTSTPLLPVTLLVYSMLTFLQSISVFTLFIRLLEVTIPFVLRRRQSSRLISIHSRHISTDSRLIKTFSLLALGICISTLSTLNFSLGFFIAVLSSPLAFLQPIADRPDHRIWLTIIAFIAMQLISPLNWFHLIAKLEFGEQISELARVYRFAWKVWGAWTPLVWWCIWWPAWLAGLVVLVSPV